MANHGYCKNCWWFKVVQSEGYVIKTAGLVKSPGRGRCYMNKSNETPYSEKDGNSYCPNYINRKREIKYGFETLEEWIKRQGLEE